METLQRAIDHHLKTTTRLEAVRKETEAERDTAETKMLTMKKKYEAEVSMRSITDRYEGAEYTSRADTGRGWRGLAGCARRLGG